MQETENKGRIVLITSGSNGIGEAMAQAFVKNGDQVVITGRREEALQTAAQTIGRNCTWVCTDVSQREQVVALINTIAKRFGKIDVLINNAECFEGISSECL